MYRVPAVVRWLYPSLTWRMPHHDKCIYLTFDDGPVPGPTEFVLDTLRHYNSKATFFCIGDNVRKHPAIFKRLYQEGHAVGNHTFHHLNAWKHPDQKYVEDIALCENVLTQNGMRPAPVKLFRPPYGRLRRSLINKLTQFQIVMWDVLSFDYERSLSPDQCLRGSIGASRPGSIVVFHDSHKAEPRLTHALPRFMEHFLNLGYSFKTLHE